jgi:probable HAF family extracellular repeat protein
MKPIAIAFLISAAAAANAQQFTDLGTLPGGTASTSFGISGDGAVVVGRSGTSSGNRAYRWTTSGMQNLGVLTGGSSSEANGVSFDGSVVVGNSDSTNGGRAFRWTSSGMSDLGTLAGGTFSDALGVSADGSVVTGFSGSTNGTRAFRWTSGGMQNLGVLSGGTLSVGLAVSSDGLVVAGYSNSSNGIRAFRWTSSDGMVDLGVLTGGTYSYASGASYDGSVIVGHGDTPNGDRAFRWTSPSGLTDLGTLAGGTTSRSKAVSADGSVVVGYSNSTNGQRAFRWTSADGMQDLGTLPGGTISEAYAVSADGNVISGVSNSTNGFRAFIYNHRVMLDVQDWLGSVGGVYSMLSTSLELTRNFMEGAHHRPLAELGRGKSYWVTGDVASSSRSRDLNTRSGEAGATFEPWTNVLVGVGAGYGRQDQQLLNGGSASTFGQYLVGELDFLLADGGVLSVLVSSGDWQNETDRGYITGSGVDYSHGETDIKSSSFRLRYDTPTLTNALGADIKAYGSYGHIRSRADAYVETGGSYTGSFSELEQTAKEGRLGVAATRKLGEKLRGRLSAEWIHRFDNQQASITATDITSTLDLTLPGAAVQRNQARFGFDLDYLMDAKTTLSFTVHAAGRGEIADVSGAVSLRKAF